MSLHKTTSNYLNITKHMGVSNVESREATEEGVLKFNILNFNGETVTNVIKLRKDVLCSLHASFGIPWNVLSNLLNESMNTKNKEFKTVCATILSLTKYMPHLAGWSRMQQIVSCLTPLKNEFIGLNCRGKWNGCWYNAPVSKAHSWKYVQVNVRKGSHRKGFPQEQRWGTPSV